MAKHSINENYNGQTKLRHWWIVIRDNLSNLLGWYNSHIDGTADRHRAEDIDYDDSGTVKEKINKIDMSLFKQTNKLPDEILTPGFYYGGGVVRYIRFLQIYCRYFIKMLMGSGQHITEMFQA